MPNQAGDSMADVQDFEFVGKNEDNYQRSLLRVKKPDVEKHQRSLSDKMKQEIQPLKDELLKERDILKKICSNLIDESSLDGADLRYKVSSLKYEMMKKDQKIGELQSKIKSFSEKIGSLTKEMTGRVDPSKILLLKKELELIDESIPQRHQNRVTFEIPLNLDSDQKEWMKRFVIIYLNTCFHVINAILIVIMMTIYYSHDSYIEKRVMISVALLIYLISTACSICAIVEKRRSQTNGSSHSYPTVLFTICLSLCISMAIFMTRHYEDASSFLFNMACLTGFCCAVNFPLTVVTCKVISEGKLEVRAKDYDKILKPE